MTRPDATMVIGAGVLLFMLVACGTASPETPPGKTSSSPSSDAGPFPSANPAHSDSNVSGANVITFDGLPGIPIGTSVNMGGIVSMEGPACGPFFTSMPHANPVIYQEQLVLIWANPPLHTPEGVMVGTPIAEARRAYPAAVSIAPTAAQHLHGLLVPGPGDLAYLILHDDVTVQRLVVGFESYARQVMKIGFGIC